MVFGHRYYDPSIGRFISQGPAKVGSNWYAYCGNDPLGEVNPSGLIHIVVNLDPTTHTGTMKVFADPGISRAESSPDR